MMNITDSQKLLLDILMSGEKLIAVEGTFDDHPVLVVVTPITNNKIDGKVMTMPLAIITDVDFLQAHGERLKSKSGISPYMPSAVELQAILHPEKGHKA